MINKVLIIVFLYTSSVFAAYNVGDTLDSKTVNTLKLQKSKIYILDFFASWCISCKIELPSLNQVNEDLNHFRYKIIGINVDENTDDGKEFVKSLNLNFPIVYDKENKLIGKFEPLGVPAIYYIKDLKVQKVRFGAIEDIAMQISDDLIELGN